MTETGTIAETVALPKRLVVLADRQRCTLLLVSLILLLIFYPYLDGADGSQPVLLEVITSLVLLAGLFSISRKPWEFLTAIVLIVPALAGNWFDAQADESLIYLVMVASEIAFFAFMTAMIFAYVVSDRLLVGARLQAALSVYLLIGVTYSLIYELLEVLAPGSIHFPNGPALWSDYVYFSFVTLTTLGYGDIAPVTAKAQSLAITEAALGVLYVAVLVAWLVSALRDPGVLEEAGAKMGRSRGSNSAIRRDSGR